MYLIDGDDLYEIDESECDLEADGAWVAEDDGSETFYEFCDLDLNDYDLS